METSCVHVHVVLTFESANKILRHDHPNQSSSAVLFHGIICFSIFYKNDLEFFLNFYPRHS